MTNQEYDETALRIWAEMPKNSEPPDQGWIVEYARRLRAEQQEQEPFACNHEPFEGRCVHCNIRFIDGEPTIIRASPIAKAPVAQETSYDLYNKPVYEVKPVAQDGMVMVPREPTESWTMQYAQLMRLSNLANARAHIRAMLKAYSMLAASPPATPTQDAARWKAYAQHQEHCATCGEAVSDCEEGSALRDAAMKEPKK